MTDTTFTINDYDKKATFSSFLPGLAGVHGIPIWCYYVNRGQCITSLGVEDKDHGIMEFFPAHQSYQNVDRIGFRTFIRKDGVYNELFTKEETKKQMHIAMNSFGIEEEDKMLGLHTSVEYFIMPSERVGALVRKLTITNTSEESIELEVLDGIPSLLPYGVNMESIKNMGHTSKAWMQAEDIESKVPYFRVRASMEDSAQVTEVEGGNFSFACLSDGTKLPVVVDPSLVFGYDTSLTVAIGFRDQGLDTLFLSEQVTTNQYPCSFFAQKQRLEKKESLVMYQVIGQVVNKSVLKKFVSKAMDRDYFESKKVEAENLAKDLCKVIDTKTASKEFDAYCKYTYMDNVLRGGYPIKINGDKIFYVYSRKHGDIERDYNYFRMLPEFYSQGNGNFRDVNQNRRCDNFFTPYVGMENIKKFYGLIQLDGYNPLAVEKVSYTLEEEKAEMIFDQLSQEQKEELIGFFKQPFTPGAFFRKLEEIGVEDLTEEETYFQSVMEQAESMVNADFGEGYWSDHWTYNLDLIESYLSIYPEKQEELLFYTPISYYASQAQILPRAKRYVKTENGVRQYHFLYNLKKGNENEKLLRNQDGNVIESTLIEKLILLCVVKYAALDAYGMGVEMEGGKPGWYDALNGMPGLFGSSMAETYELKRMLHYTIDVLEKYKMNVKLINETAELLLKLGDVTYKYKEDIETKEELIEFWNERNDVKEAYWEKIFSGISGSKKEVPVDELIHILKSMQIAVTSGIQKACSYGNEICPTYFTYSMDQYIETEEGIYPKRFTVQGLPLFLEGPVRYMKLNHTKTTKKALYEKIKQSDLYDNKLQMYKVNASLKDASYELGRAKAFTPGWLENESIWLHMEYKYLLELLKSGLFKEFAADFHNAGIPFLDPNVYGRSIYENSSFIASSKNPNKAYHGQGFVARLSGSTVEFLKMWILMMFGNPFRMEENNLVLQFQPMLPKYLVGENKRVEAMFLGTTKVIYECEEERDYFPGDYEVASMEIQYVDGSVYLTNKEKLYGTYAKDVRNGNVAKIHVKLK